MTAINAFLGQWVRKLARRELKPLLGESKKRTTEHRRAIAALKRRLTGVERELQLIKKHGPKTPKAPPELVAKARLRFDGIKAHRTKLELSAKDYGKLMGVSGLTIYNWEQRKSKPRRSQLPAILSVRGIGKREAHARLNAHT